jgi:hypothetical protein
VIIPGISDLGRSLASAPSAGDDRSITMPSREHKALAGVAEDS